jgi:hypothetical protein
MEKAGVPMANRLSGTEAIVNDMVSKYTDYIGQALDPTNPMYQDVIGHREIGRKNARPGTIGKLAGKVDSNLSLMAEVVDDISGTSKAASTIASDTVKASRAANAKRAIQEYEPVVREAGEKIAEVIESGSNKIANSVLRNSGGIGKSLTLGALGVAAGLLVSGYAGGNPLNDPDPATITQKNHEAVKAAPDMTFSSGQGFAPNNTGGYIINIKGDTRKGNRQLKKALKQATRNAVGPGSINMNVKTSQSNSPYSDREIEEILNNYF